jgi:hypothetical protein
MLIEPASNVSVPFTVVNRSLSRVPERALRPAQEITIPPSLTILPEKIQVLELSRVIDMLPERKIEAVELPAESKGCPVVSACTPLPA